MDPVTITKLLSVTNAIEECRKGDILSVYAFQDIIAKQTNSKKLIRRTKEYLRVFRELDWLMSRSDNLVVSCRYQKFLDAWDFGDLKQMSWALSAYPPYAEFLSSLSVRKTIHPPEIESLGTKKLVALDTFRSWAIATGQAYISPFDKTLYWGGDWSEECPCIETIKDSCQEAYSGLHKTSGYVVTGQLADRVCRHLYMSFQAFEIKINLLLNVEPDSFILASATSREPTSKHKIINIRPRKEVLRERLAENLLGQRLPYRWLTYRHPEDGILVKGRLIRLLKWRSCHDPS